MKFFVTILTFTLLAIVLAQDAPPGPPPADGGPGGHKPPPSENDQGPGKKGGEHGHGQGRGGENGQGHAKGKGGEHGQGRKQKQGGESGEPDQANIKKMAPVGASGRGTEGASAAVMGKPQKHGGQATSDDPAGPTAV